MVIELVEMTISTKYSGFDKLNHRFSYLLDSPSCYWIKLDYGFTVVL